MPENPKTAQPSADRFDHVLSELMPHNAEEVRAYVRAAEQQAREPLEQEIVRLREQHERSIKAWSANEDRESRLEREVERLQGDTGYADCVRRWWCKDHGAEPLPTDHPCPACLIAEVERLHTLEHDYAQSILDLNAALREVERLKDREIIRGQLDRMTGELQVTDEQLVTRMLGGPNPIALQWVIGFREAAEQAARAEGRREEWAWLRSELERLRKVSGWKVELAESLKNREANG